MKTDFSINVQVNIGVTPEVVQLVTTILQGTRPTAIAVQAASEPPFAEPAPTGKRGKTKAKGDTLMPDAVPAETAQADGEESANEAADTTDAPEEKKELTEQDVREAMHRARQRIEGEDYKNNTDSDGYRQYHKQLTATFKNISALLGSDKPSTLPADKRAMFIQQCDELIVSEGEITTKCPY